MTPGWMRATINHPPPRDERPYHVRSREELESEAEWVRAAYLDEPAPNAEFPPLCSHETEDEADERGAVEAHEEWAADGYRTEPFPADDELVPGGTVSSLPGAPGTHQDADGAVPGKAAPSVQTPAVPAYGRTDPAPCTARHGAAAEPLSWVGRGGGLDLILWAAVATALVITAVYAAVEVAHWPNVIGGGERMNGVDWSLPSGIHWD